MRKIFHPDNRPVFSTVAMGLFLVMVYVLCFLLLYPVTGIVITFLAILPAMFFGWKMGAFSGLVVGLMCLPLNLLLLKIMDPNSLDVSFGVYGGLGALTIIVLGMAAGNLHDINKKFFGQQSTHTLNEEALREGEGSFRSLFDGVPLGIYRTTPEGKLLAANKALRTLLGLAENDPLTDVNANSLFAERSDRDRWKKHMETQGIITGFQTQLRRTDGTTFWVEDNAHIVRDQGGNVIYYEGSLNDVTERKRAEQAILESETKYRNLLQNLPQKVFYKNKDLVYLAVNPKYAEDFSLQPDDFSGKTDLHFYPKDLAEKYEVDDRRILASGVSEEYDEDYFFQDEIRTVHTVKAPVLNEQGEVTGILGIFWDITDRKRMENMLLQSEQRYQSLFERSPISLWEEDFSQVKIAIDQLKSQGIQDFRQYFDKHPQQVALYLDLVHILDVNHATLNLYQAGSKDELLDNLNLLFTESAFEIFREQLIAIAEGRTEFDGEGRNCTLSGETIHIHLRWSVAPGYEQTLTKVFVSIVDINSRVKAEDELRKQTARAEALAEISKALSTASLETQTIFDITVEQITNLIGDGCLLTLVSDDRQWRKVVAFHHRDPAILLYMQKILISNPRLAGEGVIGQVLQTGKPVILTHITADMIREMGNSEAEADPHALEIKGLIIIPLISGGVVIGTLEVSRYHQDAAYTLEDQAFLQNLAIHVVLAVTNARLHEVVRVQAHTDSLTGVYNRRHFLSLAEVEFNRSGRYGRPLSLILFDLDHFKDVNDAHGHDAGDQVLQAIVDRVRNCIRSTDIVGRYGGEEFTILLPETDISGALRLAERLREQVEASRVKIGGLEIALTISLGVAGKAEDTPSLNALTQHADEAMYAAKHAGRNQSKVF